jgi:hypothetical protein
MRSSIANLTVLLLAATVGQTSLRAADTNSSPQARYSASLSDSNTDASGGGRYTASYSSGEDPASFSGEYTASYFDDEYADHASYLLDNAVGYELISKATGCTSGNCGKGAGGKDGCSCGNSRGDFFVGFDFLQWYSKDRSLPALVTTSPIGTLPADAGELNNPAANTTVLFGNRSIGGDRQAGGRLTLGLWLDDCHQRSLRFRAYANEGEDESFSLASNGDPIIGRPYFDTNPLVNNEAAFLMAYPGLFTGSVTMSSQTDVLGGDIYLRNLWRSGSQYQIDWLAGYQFNRIDDGLALFSSSDSAGVVTSMYDVFDMQNEFHAGEFGFAGEMYRDCWTLSVLGKIAVGNMRQRAAIRGNYSTTGLGARTGPGGLLAQPPNIGVYERDVAVWSPEAEIKLSFDVSKRLALSVGYTVLYWSRVALAGDLVDRSVNSAQIVNGGIPFAGPTDPSFNWRDTDYWVQAVSIGLDFEY